MDQATIEQDKANLAAAQQQVAALSDKLAADEKEFAKVTLMQELEAHAQTLDSATADFFRGLMSRIGALLS